MQDQNTSNPGSGTPGNSNPQGDQHTSQGSQPQGQQDDQANMSDPAAGTTEPEDNTPANFRLGSMLPAQLKVAIPAHQLKFDEQHFLRLLAGSLSLSKVEKKKIIESIPKLRQEQVDELIRIFEEEIEKFAALNAKHVPQLEKMAKQQYLDWQDLETEAVAANKKQDDQAKADEIRKSLGL